MKKILFFTLYDNICLGNRILSSIAKSHGIETHLIIFKDQRTRAIITDSKDALSYQFYFDGIKYGSCYGAYNYTKKEMKLFVDLVKEIKPDLVCLSTRSFGYSASKCLIQEIKRKLDIPVIGGGWGPSLEHRKFLEFCDYVCFGEGEVPISQISEKLSAGDTDFDSVNNLIYLKNGKTLKNKIAEPLKANDLNKLPLPDFDLEHKYLIDKNRIVRGKETVNMKIYNCLAGRGCPLNCSYCMSSKYQTLYKDQGFKIAKYRIRDVNIVIEELKKAKANGAVYIRISDEIFPIWKDWINKFIDLYKKEIDLPFFAYIRPEFHNNEMVKKLVSIGMTSTVVAIQAGSDRIRKTILKRMLPKEDIISFSNTLKELNINFTYHLINYNPFETENEMIETVELLQKLPYAPLVLFRLVPFEGTPIKKMIEEQNPKMLPKNIQKWYGYIYALYVKSAFHRFLAELIFDHNYFRSRIYMLTFIFMPTFIGLHFSKLLKKLKYGSATLLPIPTKQKKTQSFS